LVVVESFRFLDAPARFELMSVACRFITPLCGALSVVVALAVTGCGGKSDSWGSGGSGPEATGSGGMGAGTAAGTAGYGDAGAGGSTAGRGGAENGGSSGTGATGCEDTPVTTQKRLVPLSDSQLFTAYTALFADDAAAMFMGEEIEPATSRPIPPLATMGTTIGEAAWALRRRAAERARMHVTTNVDTLAPCGATPVDAACGLAAVLAFAEKAYRRPLNPTETASYQTLWEEVTTTPGVSVAEAIGYGYSAVLVAPGFMFRTETGGDFTTEGTITPYELASELSLFLTDGPPDEELLAAAAADQLDPTGVRAHARRILEGQKARDNIEAAMMSYFQLSILPNVVIDPEVVPGFDFTAGVRSSMYREAQEFLKNTLWQGALGDLLTSRRTWIDAALAPIYGVPAPSNDVNVFSEVTLPSDRAGLLTLSPYLTSMSRPSGGWVVTRAVSVGRLVCLQLPPVEEDDIDRNAPAGSQDWSEKEKADYRLQEETCRDCHREIDGMGLALENYDAVGRYRTEDPTGRAIDLAWTTGTLPAMFDYDQDGDGVPDPTVTNSAVTLAEAMLRDQPERGGSNSFTRCTAMNLINYALAELSQGSAYARKGEPANSCAVRAVTEQFVTATDKSFTSLLVEIAASDTLRIRRPGM
jgi:hypothetical protein